MAGRSRGTWRLQNVVRVELAERVEVDMARLERHFFTNSSCGICGKTTIDALRTLCPTPIVADFTVPAALPRMRLPEFLRESQPVCSTRNGAALPAALFDTAGKLRCASGGCGAAGCVDVELVSSVLVGAVGINMGNRNGIYGVGRASFGSPGKRQLWRGFRSLRRWGLPSQVWRHLDQCGQFHDAGVGSCGIIEV